MKIWGIGRKWILLSALLSSPIVVLAYFLDPVYTIDSINPWIFYGAGILQLAIGLPFLIVSAITMKKHYKSDKLCTTGVYCLCRNPMYTAWILFLVPGILLFFRNLLLFLIPFVMYAVLRRLLPQEEAWLEEKFGDDFRNYKQKVNRLSPF